MKAVNRAKVNSSLAVSPERPQQKKGTRIVSATIRSEKQLDSKMRHSKNNLEHFLTLSYETHHSQTKEDMAKPEDNFPTPNEILRVVSKRTESMIKIDANTSSIIHLPNTLSDSMTKLNIEENVPRHESNGQPNIKSSIS